MMSEFCHALLLDWTRKESGCEVYEDIDKEAVPTAVRIENSNR